MSHEFIDHTADAAVRIRASEPAGFLQDAARALLELYIDPDSDASVREVLRERVDLESEDAETLLVDFLNELIFRFDTRGLLVGQAPS
jgi:SHS2 domain-containing protein